MGCEVAVCVPLELEGVVNAEVGFAADCKPAVVAWGGSSVGGMPVIRILRQPGMNTNPIKQININRVVSLLPNEDRPLVFSSNRAMP